MELHELESGDILFYHRREKPLQSRETSLFNTAIITESGPCPWVVFMSASGLQLRALSGANKAFSWLPDYEFHVFRLKHYRHFSQQAATTAFYWVHHHPDAEGALSLT